MYSSRFVAHYLDYFSSNDLSKIFSYLEPLDLLRMSRTTKDLRQLLMSKSTAFVWERARLGMDGLPHMLDDINEVQYANLLFDTHCHVCTYTSLSLTTDLLKALREIQ